MAISRILLLALLGLGSPLAAAAADNTAFTVAQQDGNGKPLVFQSTGELKKGDVIKVTATASTPGW